MSNRSKVLSAIAILFLTACASSSGPEILETYRAPGTLQINFKKVAVLVQNGGPDLRRRIESQVAAYSQRTPIIPASDILGDGDMRSVSSIREKLMADSFDGVISMRLVRGGEVAPSHSRTNTVMSNDDAAGEGNQAFGGKLRIETEVYSLQDAKLIWSAIVESKYDGGDRMKAVREIVEAMERELRKNDLLPR